MCGRCVAAWLLLETIFMSRIVRRIFRTASSRPSILFDELEMKRANLNKEKLPDYPAPAVK
jgi:hypothetical protein